MSFGISFYLANSHFIKVKEIVDVISEYSKLVIAKSIHNNFSDCGIFNKIIFLNSKSAFFNEHIVYDNILSISLIQYLSCSTNNLPLTKALHQFTVCPCNFPNSVPIQIHEFLGKE